MKRSEPIDSPALSRRRVFAAGGAVGALAAAAAALPLVRPAGADAPAPLAALPDTGGGYQETQHVLQYYQTARV